MVGTNEPEPLSPGLPFDVVAIAASAGGLAALSAILGDLPADFPAAIAIVQHRSPEPSTMLEELLQKRTTLKVRQAEEGDRLTPGIVHIAPPARHLLIRPDASLTLSDSPKVRHCRPAADWLFKTAATAFQSRVIAVVLTGGDGDGSDGIQDVKRMGGRVIAQDRETSQVFGMPLSALQTGSVDAALPIEQIAPRLLTTVSSAAPR